MKALIDVILPKRCAYCRALVPLSSRVFCQQCCEQIKLNPSDDHTSLVAYAGLIRKMIVAAKFKPDESISRQLARFLRQSINKDTFRQTWSSCEVVTYVPSHFRRRLSRGHDLPAILAKEVAALLGKPLQTLLVCSRFDPPTSTKPSVVERFTAVEGRFQVRHASRKSLDILLVDDVITSGATLQNTASLLASVGHRVSTFAFAKTSLSAAASLHK